MKITFEGAFNDILDQMAALLERSGVKIATEMYAHAKTATAHPVQGPVQVAKPPIVPKAIVREAEPLIVDKPVDKPVEKRARTGKQLANDEKMRVAALARIAARRAAKAVQKSVEEPVEKPVEKPVEEPFAEPEAVDPAEMVRIRLKTIEELQAAYANGHQKEVFELLSRFGNGAKSFRELPPESFMPIRKAIDLGALE